VNLVDLVRKYLGNEMVLVQKNSLARKFLMKKIYGESVCN